MVIFDPPIYIKSPEENDNVLVFDKAPELKVEDSQNGISRFGGGLRQPNYIYAYLRSARILLNQGKIQNCLDDVGLPIFYIQRHTTELLIKRLLHLLYEIIEFKIELKFNNNVNLSKGMDERLKRSHNLSCLINDLSKTTVDLGFESIPNELSNLVDMVVRFESTETWSRYHKSEDKKGNTINHVETEVALPLVAIQEHLEHSISKIIFKLNNENCYEYSIYEEWLRLARITGRAG